MKVVVKRCEGGLFFKDGDVREVAREIGNDFYELVGLEGKRFSKERFEIVGDRVARDNETRAFQVGWVYNMRGNGRERLVSEIKDGRIYAQKWNGSRWFGEKHAFRDLQGRWVDANGDNRDEKFDLLLETGRPDGPKATIEGTTTRRISSAGRAVGASPSHAAAYGEDPSARRDAFHKPTPLPERTPFNHFPDLEEWKVEARAPGIIKDVVMNLSADAPQGWWSKG